MSVTFSLLILLIRIQFPKQFKGTTLWFIALFLPSISFTLSLLNNPSPDQLQYTDTLPIRIMSLTYIVSNLFLKMGWRKFFQENIRMLYNSFLLFLSLLFPIILKKFKIPPTIIFNTFNIIIYSLLLMFILKKYKERHSYASLPIILLNGLALFTAIIPILCYIRNDYNLNPELSIIIASITYMFRNTFVLFSIYVAVIFQFKVNHNAILEEKDQLVKELEVLSVTDSLTGLYNRRGFDSFIDYEFKQAKRQDSLYTVTLGDIDFFKNVNDSYGHDCGDYTINCISQKIQKNLREQDCLARWGGEEFIILQKNSLETTQKVIDRIRKQIEEMELSYENHIFSITMSFGIAQMSKNDTHYDKVIIHADTMLYKAKENGRNRVVY